MAGSRLTEGKRPLAAICVFVVCLGLWNAARYPTGAGFDASSHMAYADGLFPGWHLPHPSATEATEYYTPPGFYFVAGVADWLLAQTGYGDPDRAAQAVNVAYLLGTVLLVAAVARELWPGRRRIELGAAAFVAFLPVVVETGAMFHPEPMSLFLTALALWLCVRTFSNPRYAWALGATLGAAQLVRAWALATVAAVVLALLVARRWRELAVVCVLAVAIPGPVVHPSAHGLRRPAAVPAAGAGDAPPLGVLVRPRHPDRRDEALPREPLHPVDPGHLRRRVG